MMRRIARLLFAVCASAFALMVLALPTASALGQRAHWPVHALVLTQTADALPLADGPDPEPQAGLAPATGFPVPPASPQAPHPQVPLPAPPAYPLGADSGPSWYDIPGQVEAAINGWLGNLTKAVLTPVLAMIGQSVLATPDLTGGRIEQLWDVTVGLTDCCFVLLVIVGGMLVMGYETVQTRWAAKAIGGRLLFAFLAANCSLLIVRQLLSLVNALTAAIFAQDVSAAGIGAKLTGAIIDSVFLPGSVTNIFMVLLGLVLAVLSVAVLCSFILRTVCLLLLVVVAPLILACHALPMLDSAARLWWRAVGAVFAIQILQSMTLMLMIQVFFDPAADVFGLPTASGLMDLLVSCALFTILLKIPAWARHAALGRGSSGGGLVRTVVRAATFAAAGSALGVGPASSVRHLAGRVVGRNVARRLGPGPTAGAVRSPSPALSTARLGAPINGRNGLEVDPDKEFPGDRDQIPGQLALFPVPRGARVMARKGTQPGPEPAPSSGPGVYSGQLALFPQPVTGYGKQQPLFKVPREWRTTETRRASTAEHPPTPPAAKKAGPRFSQPGLFSPSGELYQAPVKLTPGQLKQRRIEAARRRTAQEATQQPKPVHRPNPRDGGAR